MRANRHQGGERMSGSDDDGVMTTASICPKIFEGRYPRQHLVQFLPTRVGAARSGEAIDPRLPVDPLVLPFKVAHIDDDRGDNFVVQYLSNQRCNDGRIRKSIWYNCLPRGILRGTPEHRDKVREAEGRVFPVGARRAGEQRDRALH